MTYGQQGLDYIYPVSKYTTLKLRKTFALLDI